jgi:hypothetical protein
MNTELAAELARMADEDQRVRKALPPDASSPSAFNWPRAMEMARIDVANTDRLREIVDEHGWPGRSLVGEEGAEHAWLLAQHASMQLDFQRRVLDLLTAAVAAGEATPRHLAYLTDRVRMLEGKEQIYGTQYIRDEHGHRVLFPIEDAVHVDERRTEVGLARLGEYPQNSPT